MSSPSATCLSDTAVNEFIAQSPHPAQIVVYSRIADYEQLTNRLNLSAAVHIQPLTDAQIQAYLGREELALHAVQATLKTDPDLAQLAQSPLMLNIMVMAYRGLTAADLKPLASINARRQHLFQAYVARMFERKPLPAETPYDQEQASRWLDNLAQGMAQHQQSIFYIERLQPTWLPIVLLRRRYAILFKLIFGLFFGLVFGLGGRLFVGLIFGLVLGLISGLIPGLVFVQVREIQSRVTPNQGIRNSGRNALKIGLFFGLFFGLFLSGVMRSGLSVGLVFGLVFGLFFGLLYGGIAFIQHYSLRWLLARQGILPFPRDCHLITYLDDMAAHILLRRVGGGWVFIHRTLLEYFASLHSHNPS